MNCVNICAICGKPIYSYESQWKNSNEFYAHDACVEALNVCMYEVFTTIARAFEDVDSYPQ